MITVFESKRRNYEKGYTPGALSLNTKESKMQVNSSPDPKVPGKYDMPDFRIKLGLSCVLSAFEWE